MSKQEKLHHLYMESLIEIRKQPIVLDAEKATLNIIDKGFYTFSSELPSACKVLYEKMKNSDLDFDYELGVLDIRFSHAI